MNELPVKVLNEIYVKTVLLLVLFALPVLGMVRGLYSWRPSHLPQAIARVEALRFERRGKIIAAVGTLGLKTVDQRDKELNCLHEVFVGRENEGFAVGRRLEVVTSPSECSRVDIVELGTTYGLK